MEGGQGTCRGYSCWLCLFTWTASYSSLAVPSYNLGLSQAVNAIRMARVGAGRKKITPLRRAAHSKARGSVLCFAEARHPKHSL